VTRARRRVAAVALGFATAFAALALSPAGAGAAPPYKPIPIGAAPEFLPAPRWPLAGVAEFRGLAGRVHAATRAHLEIFAGREVVVIPGGIGVSGGRTELYGLVTDALWTAPAWTLQPGGVIQLARPRLRLGEFFAVWGHPLSADRLMGWSGRVRAFVNGRERPGDPAEIELGDRDQVVVMVGGYVEPHASFTFTPRRDT
jgi:hypothetical protein